MKINKKVIEDLVGYLKEFNLTEIEYAEGSTRAKVSVASKGNEITHDKVIQKKSVLEEKIDLSEKVTSPIVGTAYLSPEPGAKKFIEEGQKIKKGQTIMIVEAMKTMNHVPSTQDGIVKKILIKDGEPVEFGQPLISVI